MPRSLPQHALARRALIEEAPAKSAGERHSWLHHGVAVVGISVLGLGIAGSATVTGNAQNTSSQNVRASISAETPSTVVQPGVAVPSAFDRREASVSRSSLRPALAAAALNHGADQAAEQLLGTSVLAQNKALKARGKSLAQAAKATKHEAAKLKAAKLKAAKVKAAKLKAAKAKAKAKAKAERKAHKQDNGSGHSSGGASLPITSGFHIAARFGDTGSWSRYHTGLDFAAPIGTTIHAAASGVVTHAGSGSAGWAGHYVTIRHADGKSTLYAHMSSVSVHAGEKVSAGERVGAVGMTGRTFGPHCHFEVYPAGVTPGDPYKAINPSPWLHARGLHF